MVDVPGWPDAREPSRGGPHGDFVDLYVNDVVRDAIEEAEASGESPTQWPEGSIIVKDTWPSASSDELSYLSFMERRSDGWFWGEYRRGTRLVSAGLDDSTCTGCHASGAFIRAPSRSEGTPSRTRRVTCTG